MNRVSRRSFLKSSAAVTAATTTLPSARARPGAQGRQADTPPRTAITLTVNGARCTVEVEGRWTLAELIRDRLDLTGPGSGATARAARAWCIHG